MKKIEKKSKDHWLELEDEEGGSSAIVKWDGCIHYNRYYNESMHDKDGNEEDVDYLHICNIDAFIKELEEIKKKAKEHFGNDWPNI